jgi:hypothetical protein
MEAPEMNTVYIHINETLDKNSMDQIRDELMHVPFVSNVEMNPNNPHDVLVEFEEHHNTPIAILHKLTSRGLHSDIMSC